jgi:SET domain-containing protein
MVKTKIAASKTHGIGLFAAENIAKGTVTWRFMPGLDLIVPEDILLQLSEPARALFLNYCYVDKFTKHFVLCFDDERFINHSEEPNIAQSLVGDEIAGVEIATRDIKKGEELVCDYHTFDFDAHRKLNQLDIYALTIEDEKERSEKLDTFIKRLMAVNGKAEKDLESNGNLTTQEKKAVRFPLLKKIFS